MDTNDWIILQYGFAALCGACLGYAELVSRYRDEPRALRHIDATWVYLALNAAIGVAALAVLHVVRLDGLTLPSAAAEDWSQVYLYQLLVAGFGGAAFFRTAIAKTRVADQEIGIGPALVIDTFLAATDRAIDRRRAQSRALDIPRTVEGLTPTIAAADLTELCISAMQNLSASDAATLKSAVAAIMTQDAGTVGRTKTVLIGLALTDYVGPDVLASAAKEIRRQKGSLDADQDAVDAALGKSLFKKIAAARKGA